MRPGSASIPARIVRTRLTTRFPQPRGLDQLAAQLGGLDLGDVGLSRRQPPAGATVGGDNDRPAENMILLHAPAVAERTNTNRPSP